jgi:thiamine-phosphate pyrophosphorylase
MAGRFASVYVILDAASVAPGRLMDVAQEILEAGARPVQYRDKTASSRELFERGRELVQRARAAGAAMIINDRADIAMMCGAAGVHVGQDDIGVDAARAICGAGRMVGVSTHSLEQVLADDRTTADYIAIGPIFQTRTKANPDPVVGLDTIVEARKLTRKPLVAIGGITLDNAAEVWQAGADCVAVVRDILGARSPGARTQEYLERAKHVAGTGNSKV